MKVSELGEEEVVERLKAILPKIKRTRVGAGDDCAVVETSGDLQLLKTDAVIEKVHFLAAENPERVGWKAAARVLSDFAAMGGWPRELLVTLALGKDTEMSWLEGLYRGLSRCAESFGAEIVGGETCSLPAGGARVISVAGTGSVAENELVLRSGGQPGDFLFVTGKLGGSLAGKHLDFSPRLPEARWLTKNFRPSAMMDLSDGLARDLPRLARASGCGFAITPDAIPRNTDCALENVLGDGEDYELLFSINPESAKALQKNWPLHFPELELTKIGHFQTGKIGEIAGGWEHFR